VSVKGYFIVFQINPSDYLSQDLTDPEALRLEPCLQDRMVDYILVVDCPLKWHTANLQQNKDHYASFLRHTPRALFDGSIYTHTHCLVVGSIHTLKHCLMVGSIHTHRA
jgi:hypothetical protein